MVEFGFIGCGNMGGDLARAVAKTTTGNKLLFCDANLEKARELASCFGAKVTDNAQDVAKNCRFIFLGVKPQGFDGLFDSIADVLKARKDSFVLVTMAAGVTVDRVSALAGVDCPIIRIMPNTPVAVGEGMILYCANDMTSENVLNDFRLALTFAGRLDAIPEDKIDAASAVSGCGPAFVYLFAEALADGGVECGLPRDKAILYAAQTLKGAAELLLTTGKHPGELKDAVCSPGGTTIAGVHALEDGAFRGTVMGAVEAAFKRTKELG
jgi:pyrroline-5-carboxylate reductase